MKYKKGDILSDRLGVYMILSTGHLFFDHYNVCFSEDPNIRGDGEKIPVGNVDSDYLITSIFREEENNDN